jgi:DNA-binding MarR family transcriptional regulator
LTCLPAGNYFRPVSDLQIDAEAITRLRTVICQLSRRLNVSTPTTELSPSQISVLGSIAARGPLGVKEIAELEGLNATMVSRIVGKLDAAGLIDRDADPQDRRAAAVKVTTSGRRALVRIRSERTRALVDAIERLEPTDAGLLLEALPALESLAAEFGVPAGLLARVAAS